MSRNDGNRRAGDRIPLLLSRRHAEYLIELIDEDLELDEEQHTLLDYERDMSLSVKRRLQEIVDMFQHRYERANRSA